MIPQKNFTILLLFTLIVLLISACNENSSQFVADYSDAPPLADTTTALSKVTFESGLIYYQVEEGNPESFDVVIRDDIIVYYTTRLENGDTVASSYVNGSTTPVRVNNVGAQLVISFVGEGFVTGVIGMKEGERRVLVIPENLNTAGQTLTLDIELETIDY